MSSEKAYLKIPFRLRTRMVNSEMAGALTDRCIPDSPVKILFVCHGNICRSPMAEFVMKDLVTKAGLSDRFRISSAATSTEEIGNPVHRGTRSVLARHGIPYSDHRARRVVASDYESYDIIVGMDDANMRSLKRVFNDDPDRKLHKFLEFAGLSRDVADPWYTGDFETTYQDVTAGCEGILAFVRKARERF